MSSSRRLALCRRTSGHRKERPSEDGLLHLVLKVGIRRQRAHRCADDRLSNHAPQKPRSIMAQVEGSGTPVIGSSCR